MRLNHRKSLSSLSRWFGRSTRSEGVPSHLIWILLASASKGPRYGTKIQNIVDAISQLAEVYSVTRLSNISPASTPSGSMVRSPRESSVSLLVQVDGEDSAFRSSVERIQHLLEGSATVNQLGTDAVLHWSIDTYELSQSYQPRRSRRQTRKCIVSVAIEPSVGQDEDVDAWYREEHLSMLSSNPLFLRCNRYERLRGGFAEDESAAATAKFLALHEYTSVQDLFDHSLQKGQLIEETEWSRRVLDGAKSVERTIWDVCEPSSDDPR